MYQYGVVKDVRMANTSEGTSKGFAFIEFEDEVRICNTLQDAICNPNTRFLRRKRFRRITSTSKTDVLLLHSQTVVYVRAKGKNCFIKCIIAYIQFHV